MLSTRLNRKKVFINNIIGNVQERPIKYVTYILVFNLYKYVLYKL